MERTYLNKQEEEMLKKSLLDFVVRVSSFDGKKTSNEIPILPEMTKLLLDYLVEHY